jgi:DNA adenine methylase
MRTFAAEFAYSIEIMYKTKPFIKWVGGKGQLLEQIRERYPHGLRNGVINNYVEPFLGGGALFFEIAALFKIKTAYLSDVNRDLTLTYQVIKHKPDALLDFLEQYQNDYDNTEQAMRNNLYLSVRRHFNEQRFEINYKNIADNWIPRAAQFIFLNKTCFNGLFRLNSRGEFNVPYGKYKTAAILDASNIMAVSQALQNAQICCAPYQQCWDNVTEDSFVYFDPPYRPISRTAGFTAYTGTEFTDNEQVKLACFYKKIDMEKGAKLMLSNSDPSNENADDHFFEEMYDGYNIFRVSANRCVNCDGKGRGKINELLITNYEPQTMGFNF